MTYASEDFDRDVEWHGMSIPFLVAHPPRAGLGVGGSTWRFLNRPEWEIVLNCDDAQIDDPDEFEDHYHLEPTPENAARMAERDRAAIETDAAEIVQRGHEADAVDDPDC